MNTHPRLILALLVLSPLAPIRADDASVSITAVAALTDPAKIATLKGERAANDRVHKILAWLEDGRRAGTLPGKTLEEAQKLTGDSPAHAAVVKEMLLRNFELCERGAVFTDDNLTRMKQGRAPLVVGGSFAGQPYEVDHVIPLAEFPQLGRELANLLYLPRTLNRRKSDEIKQRALDLGQKLNAAGVLTKEEYARLHEIKTWGKAAERSSTPTSEVTSTSHTVNLNKASAAAIEALPGIGPETAAKIIAARPLKDLKALDALPGFGPKKIEALRELVSF